jgi:NAD-binding of NADP-dependent 3-hydroxyisobutyrate dehydrogenase
MRLMNKDFGLILKLAAELRVPMPATAAAFQINTAKAAESSEEDFSAVIRLAENLARVNTHQNGRDNLQSSKLEIRNSRQIQMTKHKENSKRASLDSVFWILFPGAFGGKMFTWLVDTNGDWAFTIVG